MMEFLVSISAQEIPSVRQFFFSFFFCGLNVELMRQQSYLGNWMENNAYLELVLVP